MNKTSPLRLFYEYANVCSEYRYECHRISRTDFNSLNRLLLKGEPDLALLTRCFPNAVTDYDLYLRETGKAPWTIVSVKDYWRHHHGLSGQDENQDIHFGRIIHTDNQPIPTIATLKCGKIQIPVHNIYQKPFGVGVSAYAHKHFVIEVLR